MVPPETSWTLRFEAVWPVVSTSRMWSPSATAVTLMPALLLIASRTSSMLRAVDRSITAEAPLRSVMRILPWVTPLPPPKHVQARAPLEVVAEAEAERAAAQGGRCRS